MQGFYSTDRVPTMGRSLPFTVVGLALTMLAAAPSVLLAGEPRTHDGFFLRLSLGGGVANTKIDDATFKIEIDGSPGDLNIAIGGVVTPNLALHGTLMGWSMSDPDVEVDITGFGSASGTLDGDVTMTAFGGGVTYYFMPVNVYVTGSVGFGTIEIDPSGGPSGETDSGLVLDLGVGKEWWVGNAWGLGVAGGFSYHSLPDPDIDESWSGTSFTIRFSATLN
jgi:hypothetical protein